MDDSKVATMIVDIHEAEALQDGMKKTTTAENGPHGVVDPMPACRTETNTVVSNLATMIADRQDGGALKCRSGLNTDDSKDAAMTMTGVLRADRKEAPGTVMTMMITT